MKTLVLAAALALTAGAASAATLDFNELGSGIVAGSTASITGATLTSGSTGFFVNANFSNSICALDVSAYQCSNDLTIDFTDIVSGITFDVGGFQTGDAINVMIYGVSSLLGSVSIVGDGFVDLSAFSGVDYLFFDDSSTALGVDYGNVSYTSAATVPLPAGLPLLLGALGGLAALRKKRRAA